MAESAEKERAISRDQLAELLNEDLAREYQAIIAYVTYSQVLKGAEYMNIAAELEKHAAEELSHALILAGQIDYLGGMPIATPKRGFPGGAAAARAGGLVGCNAAGSGSTPVSLAMSPPSATVTCPASPRCASGVSTRCPAAALP